MILRLFSVFIISLVLIISCSQFSPGFEFNTKYFQISIAKDGSINKLADLEKGVNYLSKEAASPLMSVRIDNELLSPESIEFKEDDHVLVVTYKNGIEAKIKV